MLREKFRPWGLLDWVLDKVSVRNWSFLGCLSPEERCVSAWQVLRGRSADVKSWFIEVVDPPSRFMEAARLARVARTTDLQRIGTPSEATEAVALLARDSEIVAVLNRFLDIGNPDVILDISCFPKRFFFPFVRLLLRSRRIANLIVTYTVPESYGSGPLAEDHEPLTYLPLFGSPVFPEPTVEVAFVGVGFAPLGLSQLLEPYNNNVAVKLLFPFPPGPPAYQRNWKFISELRKYLPPPSVRDPIRVAASDVPDTFEYIVSQTGNGSKYAVYAPYGPKPISLAMCLAAISGNGPVLYTQPRAYNPEYSKGVQVQGGQVRSYAYCLRLLGRDYYPL